MNSERFMKDQDFPGVNQELHPSRRSRRYGQSCEGGND